MCSNHFNLVFVAVVFSILISPIAYAEIKFCSAEYNPVNAYNPATGECKTFSNSCKVADGWIKIDDCANAPKPEGYINKTLTFTGAGEQIINLQIPKDLRISGFEISAGASQNYFYKEYKLGEKFLSRVHSPLLNEQGSDFLTPDDGASKSYCSTDNYACSMSDFSVSIDSDLSGVSTAKLSVNGTSLNYDWANDFYFVNKECTANSGETEFRCYFPQWGQLPSLPKAGAVVEKTIKLSALKQGANTFSFAQNQKDLGGYINSAVLKLLGQNTYPHNLAVDFGADGSYEFSLSGESKGNVKIKIPATDVNSVLENCAADANGMCKIPVKIKSSSAGIVNLVNYKYEQAVADTQSETVPLGFTLDFSESNTQYISLPLPKGSNFSSFKFVINASEADYVDYLIAGSIGVPPHSQNYAECSQKDWLTTDQKYDNGACYFADLTVDVDTDIGKVTSAKIISVGSFASKEVSSLNVNYFVNKNCYTTQESECTSYHYGNHQAGGGCSGCQSRRCGPPDLSRCQWPSGASIETKWCGFYGCMWTGTDCHSSQSYTTLHCTYPYSGSMTITSGGDRSGGYNSNTNTTFYPDGKFEYVKSEDYQQGTYYGWSDLQSNIDKTKLKQGKNMFSFSYFIADKANIQLYDTTLRLSATGVYPKDFKVDIGDDGSYDYTLLGEIKGQKIIEILSEKVNELLQNCEADADGFCEVPVSFYLGGAAKVELVSLLIEEPVKIEIEENQTAAISPFALAGGDGSAENSASDAEENNSSAENILLPLALLSGAGALGYSYLNRRNLVSQNKNNYLNAGAAAAENENTKQNIFKQATGSGATRKNIDNYLLAHKTGALYASGFLKASGATAFALGALATGMGAVPAGVALAAGGGAAYVAGGAIGMGVERAGKSGANYTGVQRENIFRRAFGIKDNSSVLKFLEPRSGKIFNKTREEKIGDALALGGVSASTFGALQLVGPTAPLAIPFLAAGAGLNIGSVLAYRAAARKDVKANSGEIFAKNSSGSRENIFSSSYSVRNPNPLPLGETLNYPSDFGEAQKFALKSGATPGMIGINDKKTIGQKAQNFLVSHSEGLKKTSDGLGLVSLGLIAAALLAAPFTAGASLVLLAPAFATSVASSSIDIAVAGARGKAGIMDTDDKIRLGVSWLGFIPGGGKIAGQVGKQAARVAAKQTGKIGIKNMAAWDEFAKMSQTLGEAKFADPLAGQMKKLKFVARGILSRAKNEFTDLKSSTKYHIFGGAGIGEFAGKLGITLTNKSNTTAKKTVFFLSIIEKRAKEAKLSFRNAFKYVLMHERFIHGGLREGKQIWKKTFGFFSDDVKNILVGPGYRNLEEKLAHVLTAMRYKGAHKLIMKTGAHKALLGSQTIPSQFEIVKSVIEEFKNLGKVNKDFIRMAKTLEDVAERYGKKGWLLPASLPLIAFGDKKSDSLQSKQGVSQKINSVKVSAKKSLSTLASKIQTKFVELNSDAQKIRKSGSGFFENAKNFISGKSPSSAPTTYYNRDRSEPSNPTISRPSTSSGGSKSSSSSGSSSSKPSGSSSGSSGGIINSLKNAGSAAVNYVGNKLSEAKSFLSGLFGKK